MRYILMAHVANDAFADLSPEEFGQAMGRFEAFSQALAQSGVLRESEQLAPIDTATTVRNRDGQTLLTDGPHAELPEYFGGYWIVETADLDTALKHASDCPAADLGCVEVRPVVERG